MELQYARSLQLLILSGNRFENAHEIKNLLWGPAQVGKMNLPRGALRHIRVLQLDGV